jgi:ATP-binding cassette subfamily G (WHITE) protein 2
MGPSGSGKTTLLDVLAGRKTTGTTSGTLLFSGVPPSRAFLRRFSSYVEQFDTLLGILTVEEMARRTHTRRRVARL